VLFYVFGYRIAQRFDAAKLMKASPDAAGAVAPIRDFFRWQQPANVGAVYDRPFLKNSSNPSKAGGHRPPLQEATQRRSTSA
jgi:hypothetical protein